MEGNIYDCVGDNGQPSIFGSILDTNETKMIIWGEKKMRCATALYLKAKLTQLMRKTRIARQNTPRRAYIPISRSDSPLVVCVSSLSPAPGISTWAGWLL